MKCIVQRVTTANVVVDHETAGEVPASTGGLLVLVGIHQSDTPADSAWMAEKLVNLRIFTDDAGKLNRSLIDTVGTILLVPNFTVVGDAQKGRRPSFDMAMPPALAEQFFTEFVAAVRTLHPRVQTGRFRAYMAVTLTNDGPTTLIIESPRPENRAR